MRIRFSISIILLFTSVNLYAQSTNITTLFVSDFKKAEDFYKILAYRNALELYLHYEEKHQGDQLTIERIADCYAKLNNYPEAAAWYEKIIANPTVKPIDYYKYAEILSIMGVYDKALKAYHQYQKMVPADGRAKLKIAF